MSATPRVLVVVSDSSDFVSLAADLWATGIEAERAINLLDACLHQVNAPADVILYDADTADWTEALKILRRVGRRRPIVFLTRLADERLWLDMLQAGAFDLMAKPCGRADLQWVLTTALKNYRTVAA